MNTNYKLLSILTLAIALGIGSCATSSGYGRGLGVRGGMLSTLAEKSDEYNDATTYGLFYSSSISSRGMPIELSIDMAEIESTSALRKATIYSARISKVIAKMKRGRSSYSKKQKLLPYLIIGGGGIYTEEDDPAVDPETVGIVDVGFGLFCLKCGFDLRATYSTVIGSNNIQGLAAVTLGKKF